MNKIDEFRVYLSENEPSIVCCTETWLNSNISDSEIVGCLPYLVLRNDRKGRGGGVAIFLRDFLQFETIVYVQNSKANSVCIDVYDTHNLAKMRLLCVYRPPNLTALESSEVNSLICDLLSVPHTVVLCGDFNYNIDWVGQSCSGNPENEFLNSITSMNLMQHVKTPTRGENILDLVISEASSVSNVEVTSGLSNCDHSIVKFHIEMSTLLETIVPKPDFRKANYDVIRQKLIAVDWFNVFSTHPTVDDMYSIFCRILYSIFETTVPLKQTRSPFEKYPFYIQNLLREREQLYARVSIGDNCNKFKKLSMKISKFIEKFLRNREKKLFGNMLNKNLHAYIKSRTSSRTLCKSLSDLGGNYLYGNLRKAEGVAKYFETVYEKDNGHAPPVVEKLQSCISTPTFYPYEVEKCLKKLNNSCSTSLDNIPQFFLQKCARELSEPLSIIYNVSIMDGTVPTMWKYSIVTPVTQNCISNFSVSLSTHFYQLWYFKSNGKTTVRENQKVDKPVQVDSPISVWFCG